MGRYPFLAMIPQYLEDHSAVLSLETRQQREQRLRRIGKRMDELKGLGVISTTNPKTLTKADALAIATDMSRKNWKPQYLRGMMQTLRHFVTYGGNPVFDQVARLKLLPKCPHGSVSSLNEEKVEKITLGSKKVNGWEGEVARLVCALYPSTGLRASELRLAKLEDLDTKNWEIKVTNPKGKERYAIEGTAPVLPDARKAVCSYLEARRLRLNRYGIICAEQLIPCIKEGKPDYYSVSGWMNIRRKIMRASGVHFAYKDLRATFAQKTIDLDPSLPSAVSRAMGHKTSNTTEQYYARIRDAPAIRQIQQAWEMHESKTLKAQSPLIERKHPITGYA